MKKDTIIKFLSNRCSEEELNDIIRWANSESLDEESVVWGFEEWKSYQVEDNYEDDRKFTRLFDEIQKRITTLDQKKERSQGRSSKSTLSRIGLWVTRAAAILLIPVLTFLLYTLSEVRQNTISSENLVADSLEIVAPIGSRAVVQLPDGTEVHLNYGSKIKYPQVFAGNTREVLLSGEGYFDVAHNPEKPFIVKTDRLNVKALGTVFDVLAYPDEDIVETTLVEGKVVLSENSSDGDTKSIGGMTPGQHVNFNIRTGEVLSSMGTVEKYISWREGKLIFEDTPIIQMAEKLNRMFNVDIEVADDIKYYRYTVTFEDEPLFQILELMTIATPVNYHALPREKLPNGTFSKQKIVLKRKS